MFITISNQAELDDWEPLLTAGGTIMDSHGDVFVWTDNHEHEEFPGEFPVVLSARFDDE